LEIKNIVTNTNISELYKYKFLGVNVGEHAMAGALRFYAKAKLNDLFAIDIFKKYIEAAMLTAAATAELCKQVKIDRAVIHHGIYVPQGVFLDTLKIKHVPVVTWHVAYRKETFIFSHHDTYHHTLMSEPNSNWENMTWTNDKDGVLTNYLNSRWYGTNDWIHFHVNTNFNKNEIFSDVGVDLSKPYILALTNVIWDAQLHYPNNAFVNMIEWLRYTIESFIKRPDLQLVIRVHPAEITGTLPSRQFVLNEIKLMFPTLPDNIFLIGPDNSASTYVLAQDANAVIIYGTKTGVELAPKGLPVIAAGEAWIRNKNISIDINDPSEYGAVISELPFNTRLTTQQILRAKNYAYHYFFQRMIPISILKVNSGLFVSGFNINIDNIGILKEGNDSGLDVICNGILNGDEFIYSPAI
jgi:hypothetical protein